MAELKTGVQLPGRPALLAGGRILTLSLPPAGVKDDAPARVVRVWNSADGKLLATVPTDALPRNVALDPAGRWFAAGGEGEAFRVSHAATGAEAWKASAGAGTEAMTVAFDDRGGLVVGEADGTIRAFDGPGKGTAGGKQRFAVKVGGRPSAVAPVTVGKAARRCVAVLLGTDGCVLLDAADGTEVVRLYGFSDDSWAAIDPAGRYDAGGGKGRSAEVSKLLHWVVGNDIVEFDQLKDRFYEPGLLAKLFGYGDEPLRDVGAGLADVKLNPAVAVAAKKGAEFAATVTNRGGGIGRVVVLVNGRERSADARGPKPNPDAKEITVPLDLKNDPRIIPGARNKVEVVAYNADGSLASRGAVREFDVEPPAKPPDPTFRALVCGVAAYKNSALNLRYSAKDADDFATAVELAAANLFGKDRTKVVRLTSTGDAKSKPTRANILKALDALRDEARPEDVVVAYFAGHGVSAGGTGGDFFFLTADTADGELKTDAAKVTAVSSRDLIDRLKEAPARKQVLIFDTCASGKFVEKIAASRAVPGSQVRALESLKDRTGTFVLAGCAADAVSYESNRFGQGVLTYSLLLGMRGGALKDGDIVDVGRLFDFAADEVPKHARDLGGIQQPVVATPRGGQSFPLGRLTSADQAKIPLQPTRPAFVRSVLPDAAIKRDVLGLGAKVDDALKTAAGRGKGAPLVFIDAADMKDSYVVAGEYATDGTAVTVSANLLRGDKPVGELKATGTKDKLDDLAAKLAADAEALLKKVKP